MTGPDLTGLGCYLVFAGMGYYPEGGWLDYKQSAATQPEAVAIAKQMMANSEDYDEDGNANRDWAHVVDATARRIVWHGYREDA